MVGRIPPTALMAGAAGLQCLLGVRTRPTAASVVAAAPLAGAAAWLIGGSIWVFRRQQTTVNPVNVTAVRSLVTDGPNRLTRNPMYLGMAAVLLAHAVVHLSWLAVVPVGAFVLLIDRLQIPAEEEALRAEFGAEFDRYQQDVPRWLGGGFTRRGLESRPD